MKNSGFFIGMLVCACIFVICLSPSNKGRAATNAAPGVKTTNEVWLGGSRDDIKTNSLPCLTATNYFRVETPEDVVQHYIDTAKRMRETVNVGASVDYLIDAVEELNKQRAASLMPIAYTSEVYRLKYQRDTGYIYAAGSTSVVAGFKYETTNMPVAVLHGVTYGRGTNAVFVLYTMEILPEPTNKWRNVEMKSYKAWTWVAMPGEQRAGVK